MLKMKRTMNEEMQNMSVHEVTPDSYEIIDMTKDDLRSLLRMINSACLSERRDWNNIKEQIIKILNE